MASVFVCGPLCHPPLLRAVLGHDVVDVPGRLHDYRIGWVADIPRPVPSAGSTVEGFLTDLPAEDIARIAHHERVFGASPVNVTVRRGPQGGATEPALVFAAAAPRDAAVGAWSLKDWVSRCGDLAVAVADDIMAWFPDPVAASREGPLLVRAASRLRARAAGPATVRRDAVPGDVSIAALRQPYAQFFAVEEANLRFRRFDGSLSAAVERAAFVSADAATVLPYDPVRDRVLVIEQFRIGPHLRGDPRPWHLEIIAGRIDPGETPGDAARREAEEEAGLLLGTLVPIAGYYPSPGAKTEFLYGFLAIADLPDEAARLGGAAEEHEDIRAHVLPFDRLMDLIASGEVATGPLILSALWLSRERGRLRAEAAGAAP